MKDRLKYKGQMGMKRTDRLMEDRLKYNGQLDMKRTDGQIYRWTDRQMEDRKINEGQEDRQSLAAVDLSGVGSALKREKRGGGKKSFLSGKL